MKHKKKELKFSKRTAEHLEALEGLYKIDKKAGTVTIPLHYENASDIVDEDLGDKKHPSIKRDLLTRFSDVIHNIPDEFRINIDLQINNYEGYNHKTLLKALLNAFEYFQYDASKEKNISGVKIALLSVIGITLFAVIYYVCAKNLFGPEQETSPIHNTIHELLTAIASICLFQDAILLFMPERTFGDVYQYILFKIEDIRFLDKNKKVLSSINYQKFAHKFNIESKMESRVRKFFLVCGTLILSIAACQVIDVAESFIRLGKFNLSWLMCVCSIIAVVMGVLAGIGAINQYRGKGAFRKLLIPLGCVNILASIFQITACACLFNAIGSQAIKLLCFGSFTFVVAILYLLFSIYLMKKDKQFHHIKKIEKQQKLGK